MKRIPSILAIGLSLVALGAFAAKPHRFAFAPAGLSFEWEKAAKPVLRETGEDLVIEGSHGGIDLRIVVRRGQRIPEAQHQFRLMSYFPGEWNRTPDDCRGQGFEQCSSWSFTAERTGDKGLGMAGFGPGGTYLVVLSCNGARFEALRPAMRVIQSGVRLE